MFTAFRKLLRLLPGQQQLTNLFDLVQYIYISLVKAAVPRVFFSHPLSAGANLQKNKGRELLVDTSKLVQFAYLVISNSKIFVLASC